mmetsp:Transcript_52538/g.97271  ORF Transcript_52538/g.97271 Transcript_52538/m.97271 type:complete len:509 (-) Transcript_52538:268-1794(-)
MASSTSSGGASGVVVKNTFLEIADKAVFERDDIWRRYASEPMPVKVEQFGTGGPFPMEESVPELLPTDFLTGDRFETMATLPEEVSEQDRNAVVSSVLLLSESIRDTISQAQHRAAAPPPENDRRERRENHAHVIKDVAVTQQKPPWKDVTTVMMRNLPNKYTQQMLLEELQEAGFTLQQDLDFFYLPMDHHNAANLGYCFINFVEPYLANLFSAAFEGKKMKRFNSSKTVVVMPASIQGYDKNYQYYSSTRVVQAEDPQYRPLFLRQPGSGQASSSGGKRGKGAKEKGGSTKGAGKSKDSASSSSKGQKGGKDSGGKGGKGKAQDYAPANQQGSRPPSMPMSDMYGQAGYMEDNAGYGNVSHGGKAGKGGDMARRPAGHSQQNQGPPPPGTLYCPWCGYAVQSVYQFCPQCGSSLDAAKAGVDPSGMDFSAASLRADAPVFVPGPNQPPGRHPLAPAPPQAAADVAARYKDSVTDELDVMRGRMMLLAVLKDMEKREADGVAGLPQA